MTIYLEHYKNVSNVIRLPVFFVTVIIFIFTKTNVDNANV